MERQVLRVTARGRPFELCFMILALLLGVAYLITAPTPATVVALMPSWAVGPWATALAVSGLGGIVGCTWRGRLIVGLAIERGALFVQLAPLLILLGSFVWAWWADLLPQPPVLGIAFTAAWMAADLWRDRQIVATVRELEQRAEDQR